jgi:predicted MPP superfamily phosphohydrolase
LYRAARAGVDLVFSGHTHGGQVRLRDEEKKILPRRRFASGLYRRKDSQMYITRGIGTVVLPVRFGCPPEISLIELRAAERELRISNYELNNNLVFAARN